MELHIRHVKGYGWLLSAHAGEREIYRGEFHDSYFTCIQKWEDWAEGQAND